MKIYELLKRQILRLFSPQSTTFQTSKLPRQNESKWTTTPKTFGLPCLSNKGSFVANWIHVLTFLACYYLRYNLEIRKI